MLSLLFGRPKRRAAVSGDESWWPEVGRGRRTQAGVQVSEELALTYSAVWCASRILSETPASLPLVLYRRKSDGRERADNHPLYPLLHDAPNPEMGSMAFREGRHLNQVNWGNGFAEIERETMGDPRSPVVALWPIHACRVRPAMPYDRDARGRPLSQEYAYVVRNDDGTHIGMKAEEMLHVPGILPDDGKWGKGVIAYARESVGMGLATERHGATQFGAGNIPKVVLNLPGMKNPEARKQFRQEWKTVHGSPDASDVAIIPVEGTLEKLNFSNEDAQYLGTREFNITEIARWYRIPPHMLAHLLKAGYASVEQFSIEFVIYSLLPWLKKWEEQIQLKLLTPQERKTYYAEHELGQLLVGDLKTRLEAYRMGISIGVYSVNDCRRLENLDNVGPEGDEHYIPANLTTLRRMQEGEVAAAPTGPVGSDQSGAGPGENQNGETIALPPGVVKGAALAFAGRLKVLLAREGNAAKRKIGGAGFEEWLAGFHGEHAGILEAALAEQMDLLRETGLADDPAALSRDILADSRRALLDLHAAGSKEAACRALDAWAERSPALAERLLTPGRNGHV